MILAEFRQLTDALPGDTVIHVLDWQLQCVPAAMISKEDLVEDDPALSTFPENGIVLDREAD